MSRKNKTLRAFLHKNENPTIQQAWDHAWKGAQKEFHARSMQELRATNDRLVEALRDLLAIAEDQAEQIDGEWGDCREIDQLYEDGYMDEAIVTARSLVAQLDTKGEE